MNAFLPTTISVATNRLTIIIIKLIFFYFTPIYNVAREYLKLCFVLVYKSPLALYSAFWVPLDVFRKMLSTNDVLKTFKNPAPVITGPEKWHSRRDSNPCP